MQEETGLVKKNATYSVEEIPRINPHCGHTVVCLLDILLVSETSVKCQGFFIALSRLDNLTVLDVHVPYG